MKDETINSLSESAGGRRNFFKTAGVAALGAAAVTLLSQDSANAQRGGLDPAVLNFALNLEYLEAEFYLRAVSGSGLADTDSGPNPGAVTPPATARVNFAQGSLIQQYALEIANDELAHVRFLRSALGSSAVSRPAINLRQSFTAAAKAAGLIAANDNTTEFDPFASELNFLLASFIFEDVGVTAYKGGAPLISNKVYLEAAAGILGVEAYHAGTIRTLLVAQGAFAAAQAISDARDSLDGSDDLDQGIGSASQVNIVPTDGNGIAFTRTTTQVLNIVYLNTSTTPGGFFPNGLNGAIR